MPPRRYWLLLVFGFGIFLGHYALAGQAVYGDGIGYFAHLHSWVFDRDLNFTNEFRHIYSPENNNSPNPISAPDVLFVNTLPDQSAANYYNPGMAMLLLPFYIAADLIANFGNLAGLPFQQNGYSDLYQIFSGLGAVSYSIAGIYLLEKILVSSGYSKKVSFLSAVLIYLATHLFYYGAYDVLNSHFASFFAGTLAWYLLLSRKSKIGLVMAGLAAGLSVCTRPQDGILVLVMAGFLWHTKSKHVSHFILGFIPGLILWLIFSTTVFGVFWKHTHVLYLWSRIGDGTIINWLASLFDARNGLFSKSPILLITLMYLILNLKLLKKPVILWTGIFFMIQHLIISFQLGWTAAAYGGRMYTSSLLFFALLLAGLIERLWDKRGKIFTLVFGLGFILLNCYSMVRFIFYERETSGENLGIEQSTQLRLKKLLPFIKI
jgi:hypothetical protein